MSQCAFAESETCNKECCHFHSGSDLFAAAEKTQLDGPKKKKETVNLRTDPVEWNFRILLKKSRILELIQLFKSLILGNFLEVLACFFGGVVHMKDIQAPLMSKETISFKSNHSVLWRED